MKKYAYVFYYEKIRNFKRIDNETKNIKNEADNHFLGPMIAP